MKQNKIDEAKIKKWVRIIRDGSVYMFFAVIIGTWISLQVDPMMQVIPDAYNSLLQDMIVAMTVCVIVYFCSNSVYRKISN